MGIKRVAERVEGEPILDPFFTLIFNIFSIKMEKNLNFGMGLKVLALFACIFSKKPKMKTIKA